MEERKYFSLFQVRENIHNDEELARKEHDNAMTEAGKLCKEGMAYLFEKLCCTCLKNWSSILGSIKNNDKRDEFRSMLICMDLKRSIKKQTLGRRSNYNISQLILHITSNINCGGFQMVFDQADKNRLHLIRNFGIVKNKSIDWCKLQHVLNACIKIVERMEVFLGEMEGIFWKIRKEFADCRREFKACREKLERNRKRMSDHYIHMCLCNKLKKREREIGRIYSHEYKRIKREHNTKYKKQEIQLGKILEEKENLLKENNVIEKEKMQNREKYNEYKKKAWFIRERFREEVKRSITLERRHKGWIREQENELDNLKEEVKHEKERGKWEKILKKKIRKRKKKRKREEYDDTEEEKRPKKRRREAKKKTKIEKDWNGDGSHERPISFD